MAFRDRLKSAEPELTVDLTLYPPERGGRTKPIGLGWCSPCTIQNGKCSFSGFPLLRDEPMSPGETRRVGYVFLVGKKAVDYLRGGDKFYLLEHGIIGEASIVSDENSK